MPNMRYSASKAYVASHHATESPPSNSAMPVYSIPAHHESSSYRPSSHEFAHLMPGLSVSAMMAPSHSGSSFRFSSAPSFSSPSASSSGLHYKHDGTLDMRYNSSKAAMGWGR